MSALGQKMIGAWVAATWAVHDLIYDLSPDWLRQKINRIEGQF